MFWIVDDWRVGGRKLNLSRFAANCHRAAIALGLLLAGLGLSPSLMGCVDRPSAVSDTAAGAPVSRRALATAALPVKQTTLAAGLEHPWGLAWLPDGSLLITERPGRLRRFHNGQLQPSPVPGVAPVFAAGQGGLMDVVLHPNFAQNRWIYFTYAAGDRNNNRTQVARARWEGDRLSNWQDIFVTDQGKRGTQHFGSRLAWLPDETLLVTIGDGGNPPLSINGELSRQQAQNLSNHLGKVIRIQDDGSVPGDNPFVEQSGAKPEIWSYGHRNIQGLAVDSATGEVWATEHGSRGGDELNRLEAGQNYGWPEVSHSQEYTSNQPVAPVRQRADIPDPLVVWTPSIAPSGLTVYRGDAVSGWQGNLFAGALVDQEVRRMIVQASGEVVEVEAIAIGQRVRDVRQGPDGLLYILTDEPNGRLIQVAPKS